MPKIVFDSDRLRPCSDPDHRTFLIEGTFDERGVPGLVINCKECRERFSSVEEYDRAESWWWILQA